MTELKLDSLRRDLLAWYDRGNRDMPWRRNPEPWWVWVSEIMLQQTRVESVIGYFNRFIERYPTPESLASSSMDELMGYWAGLGYYARARNLHKAATKVVEVHGGRVPDDPNAFMELPGVGRYTCAAVQSIAFGQPLAVLDGNVIRVIARLEHCDQDPKQTAVKAHFWNRAQSFLDIQRAGDFNQAMMELGATVCTPRSPKCLLCPLRSHCIAHRETDPERLPIRSPKKKRPTHRWVAALCQTQDAQIWLQRRAEDGLLGGLWTLPMRASDSPEELKSYGLKPHGKVGEIKHGFTHLIWQVSIYHCSGQPEPVDDEPIQAFTIEEIDKLGLDGPSLKALRACGIPLKRRRGAG
ncbi:MAG: A/G-specific adenine glycosylase [Bradymonadia bacterium]